MSESVSSSGNLTWWSETSAAAALRFEKVPDARLTPAGRLLRNALLHGRPAHRLIAISGSATAKSTNTQSYLMLPLDGEGNESRDLENRK